jgi:anti-sigma regulatory factor (Ser/Thr protein kinase)
MPDGMVVAGAVRKRAELRRRSRHPRLRENSVPVMASQAVASRTRWAVQSVMVVAALPTATPCARLHARSIACEWGLGDLAETVELVVSELVTNAVLASVDHDGRPRYSAEHGLACVHLRLSTDKLAVLIEVWDENAVLPEPGLPDLDDESGRGLMLVDALAEHWGWDLPTSGRGKVVWALVGCASVSG